MSFPVKRSQKFPRKLRIRVNSLSMSCIYIFESKKGLFIISIFLSNKLTLVIYQHMHDPHILSAIVQTMGHSQGRYNYFDKKYFYRYSDFTCQTILNFFYFGIDQGTCPSQLSVVKNWTKIFEILLDFSTYGALLRSRKK